MADIGGATARIKQLEEALARYRKDCAERNAELSLRNFYLRRALDNIKIRAYELGVKEIHDMALEALQNDD